MLIALLGAKLDHAGDVAPEYLSKAALDQQNPTPVLMPLIFWQVALTT